MTKKQSKNVKIASFSVMALCFCSLMVFLNGQDPMNTDQAQAFERAEIYATQMIKNKFMVDTKNANIRGRSLASVTNGSEVLEGPVGLDPWGYPFNFLVKKNAQNPEQGVVVIWSRGADNKLETSRDMIAQDHTRFSGDDFGKVYTF